jgi:hypothetical protein
VFAWAFARKTLLRGFEGNALGERFPLFSCKSVSQ